MDATVKKKSHDESVRKEGVGVSGGGTPSS